MRLTAEQLRQIIEEEMAAAFAPGNAGKDPKRFLHGFDSGHPLDHEGNMVKVRMAEIADMAQTVCDLIEKDDQLPAWVQDLVAGAHRDMEHVSDYLVGTERMRKKAPPPAVFSPKNLKGY